ncbi:MAG: minor capsid protein [Chromatiaceae bacterium]|nr:minor capsid protein [Chromatiaceae bacterium]
MPNLGPLAALFNLRPDRAADYLLAKGFKLSGPYWELDGPAHSHVFTVANLAKLDVLADIKGAVQQAIDEGQTEKWFETQLVDVLKRKGWWGPGVRVDPDTLEAKIIQQGSLRRLQTIYRTNLQTAYMAGRHRQAMEQIDRRPWAQYLAIRDHRTRPAHAALHGQVFRLDSPAWAVVAPSNSYNCRCRARYLSDRDLENKGLKPAADVRILEREPPGKRPVDPLTGETPARWLQRGVSVPDPLNPGERLTLWADPGWDHLPGSDGAERALVDKLMAKAEALGDGIKMAVQAGRKEVAEKAVASPLWSPVLAETILKGFVDQAAALPGNIDPEERLTRLWTNEASFVSHLKRRKALGHAESAEDLARQSFAALASIRMARIATGTYPVMELESGEWTILIDDRGRIKTVYRVEAGRPTFSDNHRRLGYSVYDIDIDQRIRNALARIFGLD